MTNYVRRAAGTHLTEEEQAQLRLLVDMPDAEIDLSDIPESTEAQLRGAMRRNGKSEEVCSTNVLDKAS